MRKFTMSKLALALSLVAGAYAAGAGVGADEVLAFVAPAVPSVTFFGDAIWSVVSQVWAPPSFGFISIIQLFLCVGAFMAFVAGGEYNPSRFMSKVKDIWDRLPEVDGKRSIPVWAAFVIPPVAVVEFFARVFYFAGFTVVALTWMPLKSVCTFDLRFLSSKSEGGRRA